MRSRTLRRIVSLLGAALWLLLCSGVDAQNAASFRIAVAGERCVSAARLTEMVEERARGAADALDVDVAIERLAAGFRARVEVRDARGRNVGGRELEVDGPCSELAEVLTLVIASSVGLREVSTPVPEPTRRPSQTDVSEAPAVTLSAGTPARWTVSLHATGRVVQGLAPSLGFGPDLGLFVGNGRLMLGLSGLWLPPRVSAPDARPVRTSGALGELHVCACALGTATNGVALCAGVQAGALRTVAQWLPDASRHWNALVQLLPGMRGQLRVWDRFGITLGLGASLPLLFPRFRYVSAAGSDVEHHAATLGFWGELGVSVGLDS
jgi:hypothetical protein